jgi:IS5 family transposase
MLPLDEFIIFVYCCITDRLNAMTEGKPLRKRGFSPVLTDAEVITMEIVGEFLGIDTDKGIWEYFRRHWRHFFPALGCRTTFVRQAANLWCCKIMLQEKIAKELVAVTDPIHIVDGFPVPVCNIKRAFSSEIFQGEAAYGFCASKGEKYYGFEGHLLISSSGVITSCTLTAANIDEREALPELLPGIHGLLIGDKGYISFALRQNLLNEGIDLQTPHRKNMHDGRSRKYVSMLMSVRRRVETVIGQLTERFNIEKVRARDIWHLTSRIARKLLGHTVGILLNRLCGRDSLELDGLIAA